MKRQNARVLIVCTVLSLSGELVSQAVAQTVAAKPAKISHRGVSIAPAKHRAQPAPRRDLESRDRETIAVRGGMMTATGVTNTTPGGGLMPVQTAPRAQSGITRDYIAKQSPTANVQSLVGDLPGVVTYNQDPLGITGNQMNIRGMNEEQIGFVFEGVPIADPIRYEPYTSTVVDTENLGSVTVSQGSPDLDSPLYNAVGGEVKMTEIDPSHHSGGFFSGSGGTHSANKEFLRLETGDIGHSGVRGFVSFSHASWNNWRGPGGGTRYHVDAKFLKDWGTENRVMGLFSYTAMNDTAYLNPTLAQWQQYGWHYNFNGGKYNGNDPNYYKLNASPNNSMMVAAPSHFRLTREVVLDVRPYFMHMWGPSPWGERINTTESFFGTQPAGTLQIPGMPNPPANTLITTQAVDPWDQKTSGLNISTTWKHRFNTLTFGYWYSYTQHTEEADFQTVAPDGTVASPWNKDPILTQDGHILSGWNLSFKQQNSLLYLSDSMSFLHDRLTITGAFKADMMWRTGSQLIPGADPYLNIKNYFAPMPQFYASYKISDHDQVYVNGTTSFRAPGSVEAYSQLFDPSRNSATEQPGNLKPEYSIGEEIGYRHHDRLFNVSLAAFNYNITNHQVTSYGYVPGTNTLVSEPLNVGGETSRGVSAELGLGHWHHFSPYLSGQYLHATFDNDYNAGSGYLPTAGKTAVDTPKFTAAIGLQYDDGRLFGNFDLRYVDSQYTTFMSDQSIAAYTTANLALGYRLEAIGAAKHPQIQINFMNLGNNHYLAGASSNTGAAHDVRATNGQLIAGAAPVYVVGGGFATMVSVSTGF